MPELGNRANVMGPQPISAVKQPPPAMVEAADRFLTALIKGDRAVMDGMTDPQAREQMLAIAEAVHPGAYNGYKVTARARVAQHHYTKARLESAGAPPFTLQFRLGEDAGRWTVREITNLTNVRSGWSKQG